MGEEKRKKKNLLIAALLFFGSARQVQGQEGTEGGGVEVAYRFGEEIQFSGRVTASNPIKEVLLLFRDVNEENTRIVPLELDADGQFSYTYDASDKLLRPFAKISYWLQIALENEESQTREKEFFIYADNPFEWEMREENSLRVYWAEGDEAFGLAGLDAARAGLAKIETLFPVDLAQPIDIYIYPSPTDLQNALFMGGETWVAGHASPTLGIVLVAISPGETQNILMQQKIPHELAHILLYRHIGAKYNRLPTWLLEGTASIAELYPNPDFQLALERAVENDALIPIAELCDPFPRDASQAFLAYAEAESFTRYLQENYGSSGLDDLITAYADGLSCEIGATRIFGKSLTTLDVSWQESVLGTNLLGIAWRALRGYVLLLGVILAMLFFELFSALWKRKYSGG